MRPASRAGSLWAPGGLLAEDKRAERDGEERRREREGGEGGGTGGRNSKLLGFPETVDLVFVFSRSGQ